MALHELATNGAKYGALSDGGGHVLIAGVSARNRFPWSGSNSPPVVAAETTGIGTRMIEQILANDLCGKVMVRYERTGLICRIEAPAASVLDPTSSILLEAG